MRGGLASYGAAVNDQHRRAADYIDRRPADSGTDQILTAEMYARRWLLMAPWVERNVRAQLTDLFTADAALNLNARYC
jgi:hypothetical protein